MKTKTARRLNYTVVISTVILVKLHCKIGLLKGIVKTEEKFSRQREALEFLI
jgi:hypothetical protein